ncbi:MAG: bifunctional indole-3-glycerol-phosphate synthase TrpC/phosphoribosylanthranilate isomerase TrpF [Sphingomonas sp.]|nr:bifunctional indole-3-glycerol-phosphate synthase TrpC/phosphoribosylanthranilate isomerase TrpF [Sphingomonas sp.]RZV53556.1 MAG: bifunctional indole-3-glycerol-phosphate synthase TrpC/phosphoribosylanthranilate isomerase TrpF [Sphingomonadaceae bacterium]
MSTPPVADTLARIVARKRVEVAGRLDGPVRAEPTKRSLIAALRQTGARFIMEVKPRSPSGHVAKHSPGKAIRAYAPVADAVSILTDGEDFGGSLDLLRDLRAKFDGPILAKDFIVDVVQVSEARAHGADAVLCMLSVLDDEKAAGVLREAALLGMDVLVEVHDEEEMARAAALGAKLIGINNRDLKTLKTDLAVTERLAAMAPSEATLISESGIKGRGDVKRIGPLVDGFLVGSHLMAADDIDLAARELVHGAVKICGLTREEDVLHAAKAGATHAGLILVPDTPRALDDATANVLAELARGIGLKPVGVFRGAQPEEVAAKASALGLSAAQLHESDADLDAVLALLDPDVEVWALAGVDADGVDRARSAAHRTLFDTISGSQSGGTGCSFDWSALEGRDDLAEAFVAGGITPQNAAEAAAIGAYGIDTSSGVEARPRVKDPAKIDALFAALRGPAREQV